MRAHALFAVDHEELVSAAGFDPVELGVVRSIRSEERGVDVAEFLVLHAGGLVGALPEAVGFVDEDEVERGIRFADLEGSEHHCRVEAGCPSENFPHGFA